VQPHWQVDSPTSLVVHDVTAVLVTTNVSDPGQYMGFHLAVFC